MIQPPINTFSTVSVWGLMVKRTIGFVVIGVIGLLLTACGVDAIPAPTVIPTDVATQTATITPPPPNTQTATLSPAPPSEPPPTIAPLITATPPPVAAVISGGGGGGEPTAPPAPRCFVARAGDTLITFASRAGYSDLSVLPAIRALNGLCETCNDIAVGREYCVPRPTATPTAIGYEATVALRQTELAALPTQGYSLRQYTVVEKDTIIGIQLKTGTSLADLCRLNEGLLNCAGCKLDKPVGENECRVLVVVGWKLNYPGPPPTPTITPTFTGMETATPTPIHPMLRVIAPLQEERKSGAVSLRWLPVPILAPDEFYLVMWSNAQTGDTRQVETRANSLILPAALHPPPGQTHTIYWRVSVARRTAEGGYLILSPEGVIYTFLWQGETP
ncbi:MAG TPA: hypothetical protein PLD47_13695 [Aggregatilineales bacterium]|nr:hypothetical protein [Anaerolineales bacterium]HRE48774.1 hypothetical protein [Aggregatilineales bacterium]